MDLDVLTQVRALDMGSLRGVTDIERIGKIIRKRMDDSFVTAYELIKDEKERREYQQQCLNPNFQPPLQIFSSLPNKLRRTAISDEQRDYLFGKSFTVGARRLMEAIFALFQEMDIEFAIKSTPAPYADNQYSLLCVYYPPRKGMRRKSSHMVLDMKEDKLYGYQD